MVSVSKLWPGETFVCIGGGPSLTQADVDACRGRARVITINDAYKLAPWAEVLYACDAGWWKQHQGVPSFTGLKFSLAMKRSQWPEIQMLASTGTQGLERHPTGLRTGMNSGYQAINLAVHLGATRIVLLGYDMKRGKTGAHWFGDHPTGLRRNSPYVEFLRQFPTLVGPLRELGIAVINATRDTALTCFPRQPLQQALQMAVAA